MDELLERIQASKEEIEAQFQNIHACEIDGELRWIFWVWMWKFGAVSKYHIIFSAWRK